MDGDIVEKLDDILDGIYLAPNLQSNHIVSLINYLNKHELDENFYRQTINFLLSMFDSRTDSKFCKNLSEAIFLIANENGNQFIQALFAVLIQHINRVKKLVPTKTVSAKVNFFAKLLILFEWEKLNENQRKLLIESHSIICGYYGRFKNRIFNDLNYKCLKKYISLMKESSLNMYLTIMKEISSSSSNVNYSILWDNLFRFLINTNQMNLINSYKQTTLDLLVKNIIFSKTKLTDQYDSSCFQYTLSQISRDEFQSILLPSLQKAILRNPEISLILMVHIIEYLNMDLSDFTLDICKILGAHLHSKNELLQEESLEAVKIMSQKCTEYNAIESALIYFVKIYNGSEGKLTVLGHRHTMIKSIGYLSFANVNDPSGKKKLLHISIEELIKMLKQETLESSFVLLFQQIKLWIRQLSSNPLPDSFWKFIKEFAKSKSASPPTLAALYECLIVAFESNLNDHIAKIDDSILSFILNSAKNVSTALTKLPMVIESLNASIVLLKIYHHKNDFAEKMKNFLTSMHNLVSITFLTDKFIAQVSIENLANLIDFIFNLMRDVKTLDTDNQKYLYKAIVLLMCHYSREIRDNAIGKFNDYCQENESFQMKMIQKFNDLYQENRQTELERQPNNYSVLRCAQALLNSCNQYDEDKMLNSIIHLCHHSIVFQQNPNLFIKEYLHKHFSETIKINEFIDRNFKQLTQAIFEIHFGRSTTLNLSRTLMKWNPHRFAEHFVLTIHDDIIKHLTEFKSITKDDFEIFKTPEDHLYNRAAVIEAGGIHEDKNLKRESKLYSHKEQLAEIQLRKELEEKRKNQEPEFDPSKFSKKQKEIYIQEMAKEKKIRDHLQSLYEDFLFKTDLLSAIMDTNPIVASIHFKDVLFTYVNLFASRLTFEKAVEFFKSISSKMMISPIIKVDGDYSSYIQIITNTIINLYSLKENSKDDIDLVEKIIDYIYNRTCPNMENYDEKLVKKTEQNRLTTPAFTFVFPIFRFVLLDMIELESEHYEKIVEKCLIIINEHAKMRCYTEKEDDNLKNPGNLPIKLILETLFSFMENEDADTGCDELVANTLIEVVTSVNNEIGCGTANPRDILVLLSYTSHQDDLIRLTCFESLFILTEQVLIFMDNEYCRQKLAHRCFIGQFDILPDCQAYSNQIFKLCHFITNRLFLNVILDEDLDSINLKMTQPVSEAFKNLVEEFSDDLPEYYGKLIKFYQIKAAAAKPVLDNFGRPMTKNHIDQYEPRLTIAYILEKIVHLFDDNLFESFINFLIPEALGDQNELVRRAMLDAGRRCINVHGEQNISYLLRSFETFLDSAPDDHETDIVRESLIILMGTLARHIESDNPKLKPILSKLVEALSTPSKIVQEAVANCLQYLIPKFKDDAPALLQKLLAFLFHSDSYGERKGAAYGIAGIVKGLGILSLNKMGIMDALTQAIQAKDKSNNREGALFAFEMLSRMLGRLFEPYIVHILPHLLDCFGDSSTRVRKAADDTAKVIMSNLTAYGVTLIYPAILIALEDDSWRKKTSSIELLGSMAFCAPKQLSQCLPKIVPKLMDVLNDSHPKVQRSAGEALKQIGSVIKNPEIQEIVPVLLNALQDPANKTNECLNVMMKMKFVHIIDPPSLALIMPVIERAFQNRSTETRKMASQIVGNMYALAKSKDLSPYLSSIIPGLKNSLLDPVPEVRTATARALGAMVRSLGNEILDDLRPWLERMLISEQSSVDRSGAAQGLAEVLGGLGKEHLDKYMPKILEVTENPDVPAYVKDGFIMLYIYLPSVFTQHFASYISRVITPILKALADENEFVRETSLRAGQRIVNMYAETAIQLLLPELERGLFNENWRIRYSSVQLLGDLLFKITGLSGKMTTESQSEDDNFGTDQSHQALFDALGEERRNRVLSGLYMGRSDVSLQVRQASLHVWKVIVPNTPRTLREILPVLFTLLLECLASNSHDRQQIGARTLGDLVRKLGERILPEIIPILEDGLKSDRPDQRQGVCIGLSEIIVSTSREMVQVFADNFIATVRKALFDSLPEVRLAAAQSFDHLHTAIGEKCLGDILNHLLNHIDDPKYGERVLDSLKAIISYKSRVVLPNLIPKLTTKPVNTRALSIIASVAGESFSKHLHLVIPPLLSSLSESFDNPNFDEQLEYCQNVIVSIADEDGARAVILTLLDASKSNNLNKKRAAIMLLSYYCTQSKPGTTAQFNSTILTNLIDFFASNDECILSKASEAMAAIIKNLDKWQQVDVIPEVYRKLYSTLNERLPDNYRRMGVFTYSYSPLTSNYQYVDHPDFYFPGFFFNKTIQSLLNLFNKAITGNNFEIRVIGCNAYRMIVIHSSPEALKPSSMILCGSMLRLLCDHPKEDVKIIVIDVLSLLLMKMSVFLKPFYPQIQMIFLRSLFEPVKSLRLQAATCISRFAPFHPKPDAFLSELLTLNKNCPIEPPYLKETGFFAIRLAIVTAGERFSSAVHRQVYEYATNYKEDMTNEIQQTAASVIGSLCRVVDDELFDEIGHQFLLQDEVNFVQHARKFRSIVLGIALKDAAHRTIGRNNDWSAMIHQNVLSLISSSITYLAVHGIKCAAYIIHYSLKNDLVIDKNLLHAFAKAMNHQRNEVKQAMNQGTIFWANRFPSNKNIPDQILLLMVPQLVNGTKEKNSSVRAFAEQALISLLKLREENSSILEKCLKIMGSGAVESLQECVAKIKKSVLKNEFKEEEFDETLIFQIIASEEI